MSNSLNVVPWYNSAEWNTVYTDIFSENPNYQNALNLLLTWKARSPFLPSGIEATLCLLQVHAQEHQSHSNLAGEQILRLAYSSAIMRFVNHTLDSETAKGTSLYQAAKFLGVPDWIVDLRHDTAHNNNLPTLTLLQNACSFSLQWLQKNYWDVHKECILDYECGGAGSQNIDEAKIGAMLNFLSSLSICKQTKIRKVADIPDMDMQESILNDAKQTLETLDFSNLKNMSITNLINILVTNLKKCLKNKKSYDILKKSFLDEDSLLLSLELVDYICKNDFNNKEKLSRSYVQCFEVLLTVLHTNDLILDLIMDLVDITTKDTDPRKALLAALWISEILKALKASKQFIERTHEMSSDGIYSDKKRDLKQMYHHWFPNEKKNFVLDLQKPVPSKLKDINFIKPIITSYNSYLTYFVHDLLVLVEPHLPKSVSQKICKLAKLISAPEKFPVNMEASKIYTVEDVEDKNESINDIDYQPIESSNSDETISNNVMQGIWKLASKKHNWATCPIGRLPCQQTSVIPMES